MKFGCGLTARSHRVVKDILMAAAAKAEEIGESRQGSWANLPQELLREVLIRVEALESSWPSRRNVVACAGVCRCWREVVKEVVGTPEVSGKFTFPISVKQPGSRDSLLQCFIRRNRLSQTYRLYLSLTPALAEDGKFLLAAHKFKRPTCTDYNISLQTHDMSKGSSTYIGKLRSNCLGTKFVVYDGLPPHGGVKTMTCRSLRLVGSKHVPPPVSAGNYPVAHILYELNVLGSRGPRKMQCVLDTIPTASIEPGGVAPTQTEFPQRNIDSSLSLPFLRSKPSLVESFLCGPSTDQKDDKAMVLKNKAPRWHEQLQCWCLNFHGRVTVASVKNFQLVASSENEQEGPEREKVILQFGKVGKDVFTMDYRYPLSAFQAFAICLSSFDTKIACE